MGLVTSDSRTALMFSTLTLGGDQVLAFAYLIHFKVSGQNVSEGKRVMTVFFFFPHNVAGVRAGGLNNNPGCVQQNVDIW